MADVNDAFAAAAWSADPSRDTGQPAAIAAPKYCITEMSAAGLVAIGLGLSAGLWLAIAAVI